MARVGRLAGAILAQSGDTWFLIGNPKEPCDWARAGFTPPGDFATIDARTTPFVRLAASAPVELSGPWLTMDLEGEALARALHARFVIARTGSVSERLWRMVLLGGADTPSVAPRGPVDARWLGEIPQPIWDVVRDAVLRCA